MGIERFLQCEAKTGYILDAEIYRCRSWTATGPSSDQLAGHQQEPHAVYGLFLQLCHALPPAEERIMSTASGHRHAKPQALPKGTLQEADQTWPVRILVLGMSVCHCLEGPQAHLLPEELPQPEESIQREQAFGGQACTVDRAKTCG